MGHGRTPVIIPSLITTLHYLCLPQVAAERIGLPTFPFPATHQLPLNNPRPPRDPMNDPGNGIWFVTLKDTHDFTQSRAYTYSHNPTRARTPTRARLLANDRMAPKPPTHAHTNTQGAGGSPYERLTVRWLLGARGRHQVLGRADGCLRARRARTHPRCQGVAIEFRIISYRAISIYKWTCFKMHIM